MKTPTPTPRRVNLFPFIVGTFFTLFGFALGYRPVAEYPIQPGTRVRTLLVTNTPVSWDAIISQMTPPVTPVGGYKQVDYGTLSTLNMGPREEAMWGGTRIAGACEAERECADTGDTGGHSWEHAPRCPYGSLEGGGGYPDGQLIVGVRLPDGSVPCWKPAEQCGRCGLYDIFHR